MTFTPQQIEDLNSELDGKRVKSRTGGGRQLSYIEGWWAIAEANRIFGHDGWHRETVELRLIGDDEKDDKGRFKCAYLAKVKITVTTGEDKLDVVREGVGFGNGLGPSRLDAHELAAKEAETDATKRALMTFGWPFGLALYDKTQEHVDNGHSPIEKTLAHGSTGDIDTTGMNVRTEPGKQAKEIANLFVTAPDMASFKAEMNKQKAVVSSLHKQDRDYLKNVAEDCMRGFQQEEFKP